MATIIVAFPKLDDAKTIKNLLTRKGYNVAAPLHYGSTDNQLG